MRNKKGTGVATLLLNEKISLTFFAFLVLAVSIHPAAGSPVAMSKPAELQKMPPPDSYRISLSVHAFIEGLYNGTCKCAKADTVRVRLVNRAGSISLQALSDELGYVAAVFDSVPSAYYYIVIEHRNSIRTWSADSMFIGAGSTEIDYDFTSSAEKAYGSNLTIKNGKYCIYSGDVNQDGMVDYSDLILIDEDAYNYVTGYVVTDLNGDEMVDFTDLSIAENNSTNYIYEIAPF